MERKIYWALLISSLMLGTVLYYVQQSISGLALIVTLFILSMILIGSIHGIIAHSLYPSIKGGTIVYPVVMGVLFALLFFLFIFFVMPLFFPEFRTINFRL